MKLSHIAGFILCSSVIASQQSDSNEKDHHGLTELHRVILSIESLTLMEHRKFFIESAEAKLEEEARWVAHRKEKIERVHSLLLCRADPNGKTPNGRGSLELAFQVGADPAIIRLLINYRAKPSVDAKVLNSKMSVFDLAMPEQIKFFMEIFRAEAKIWKDAQGPVNS